MTSNLIRDLKAGHPRHIVAYGTSLTAGGAWVGQVRDALSARFPGLVTVTNSGKGSMWSKWGVDNLDELVIARKPDAVFIEFGINDAYRPYRTSVADARANLENMIDRIAAALPACDVILMTMNECVDKHREIRPCVQDYYQMYRDVAAARRLLLIDHYPRWVDLLAADRAAFDACCPDGIHPNALGAERIITPAILAALDGRALENTPAR